MDSLSRHTLTYKSCTCVIEMGVGALYSPKIVYLAPLSGSSFSPSHMASARAKLSTVTAPGTMEMHGPLGIVSLTGPGASFLEIGVVNCTVLELIDRTHSFSGVPSSLEKVCFH